MKKLKLNDPSDLGQFIGILIIVAIVGTCGVAGLEKLFGIVVVFAGAVLVTVIAGIYAIILEIRKHSKKKEDNWVENKKKELTKYIHRNDS